MLRDVLESRLHELVCQGKMPLATAENGIATDWIGAYKKHFHTDRPQQSPSAKYSGPRQRIFRQYLSAFLQ